MRKERRDKEEEGEEGEGRGEEEEEEEEEEREIEIEIRIVVTKRGLYFLNKAEFYTGYEGIYLSIYLSIPVYSYLSKIKLESVWNGFLRKMVANGYKKKRS